MAQGPHPWPPRGAFWPPPTPPKHSQCGPVEGAGFVPTSPNQPGHLQRLPAGLARGHCTTCGPWGQGLAQRPTPNPWRGGWLPLGQLLGSFREVPCKVLWPQLHHNGARQHTQALCLPHAPCTFLWAVFFPGLVGAARNGPLWAFGGRPAAAWAVSWKFPGNPPQHACGLGCTPMGQDSPNLRALSYR